MRVTNFITPVDRSSYVKWQKSIWMGSFSDLGACVLFLSISYFILNKRTGFLIIKENAPPGTYQFQVRVSDGIWPDAVSTVTVHVRELRDDAIYNSGSLRLAGKINSAVTREHAPCCLSLQMSSSLVLVASESNFLTKTYCKRKKGLPTCHVAKARTCVFVSYSVHLFEK